MKLFKKLGFTLAAFLVVPVLALTQVKSAQAAQIPYVPGEPLPTTSTPRFNPFTNVPNGVGNEADFVRIRTSTGDPKNNGAGGERNALYIDTLNAACNVGDMYDVRTYIHNGADPDFNQNGTGTAVAHDVMIATTAQLNTNGTSFTFGSTLSASNAATVSDTGKLNCSKNARLELVASTVYVYSKTLGWVKANDSLVNGSAKVGSHAFGSGDVWACWDERVLVVYTVKVVEIPTPPQPVYTCDALAITPLSNRKYKYEVTSTVKNGAVVKSVTVNYGDNTSGNGATTEHTYTADGTYQVVATVVFTVNGADVSVTNDNCKKQLVVKGNECPTKPNVPVDDPSCKPCPVKPSVNIDSPECKCPTNPSLPYGDSKCKVCPTNPALNYDDNNCKACPTNPKLNYDNKDCKKPSVLPKTGMGGITALASIGSVAGYVGHSFVTRKRNR